MRIFARVALALTGLFVLSTCNDRPSLPPTTGPGPLPPAVLRIEISGPSEIEPGEAVQFTVTAFKADNTTENVTPLAIWSLSSTQVLTVTPGGLVTGRARGEQTIQARYQTRSATRRILVLPRGTFKLSGHVRESGFGIENAEVSVIGGTGQGLSTRSGFDGTYALYGVAGGVRIQVSRDGYQTRQLDLDVGSHRVEPLDITALQTRPDYRGVYTLTITAATCRFAQPTFPEEARRRVYTATVSQDGGRLTVKLSDANLLLVNGRGDQFTGFVDVAGGIRFAISDSNFYYYYYYYLGAYDIMEVMSTQALVVVGAVTAQGSPSRITGVLNGSLNVSNKVTTPLSGFASWCPSQSHGFEMVRR